MGFTRVPCENMVLIWAPCGPANMVQCPLMSAIFVVMRDEQIADIGRLIMEDTGSKR